MNDKNTVRHIIEDLLPLYEEGLLSEETAKWLEAQTAGDPDYARLVRLSGQSLLKPELPEPAEDYAKMMAKINRKLSFYQLLFMAISFVLAIRTSLLNESFGFVLWYAVLGFVTYLFYKQIKIVLFLSFAPVFLWSLGDSIYSAVNGSGDGGVGMLVFVPIVGAVLTAFIHSLFAFIGSLMGLLVLKIRKTGDDSE
ncbi:hypothetical protein [Paenibacillus sp. UNC499MF]|uniref:hypothetical protein n=1 Tax=Paenibacillus sp. UNC499MF TaxID=1502751 RepID=UPI00089FDED1|nr:hypothetical protein [Paenibacillus sp. UNC499MF]SEG57302.1 hypothetical protein SAMN02799616_03594 [Paenibacillus sp. UNC499MF]